VIKGTDRNVIITTHIAAVVIPSSR